MYQQNVLCQLYFNLITYQKHSQFVSAGNCFAEIQKFKKHSAFKEHNNNFPSAFLKTSNNLLWLVNYSK